MERIARFCGRRADAKCAQIEKIDFHGTRQFAELGEGNLDWADIIPRCEKNGVPYAVIEQDGDFMTGPFESLTASRNFLVKAGYWKQGT